MRSKFWGLLFFVVSIFNSSCVLAESKDTSAEDTIPFALSASSAVMMGTGLNPVKGSCTSDASSNIKEVSAKDVEKLIKQIRTSVCKSAGNADIKVWLTVGVNASVKAKIIEVGTSSQSGLEVTIHCNEK